MWIILLSVTATLLWFTRSPGFFGGWASLFPVGYVTDGTIALGIGLLLFIIPREKPVLFQDRKTISHGKQNYFKYECRKSVFVL